MPVLDVDKGSSGSKQKFCIHSIFSMSAGVGRGSLKCEDDRSLLSQRLWSDILMCLRLNHAPTHTQPQTSGISTKPETFSCLTSSYYTFRPRFDLILTHINLLRYHVTPPCMFSALTIFVFLRACDEFGAQAQYLKHLSVRCGVSLHFSLQKAPNLPLTSWYNPFRVLVQWTWCRHINTFRHCFLAEWHTVH